MELSPEEKLHCEAALLPGERRAAAGESAETDTGTGLGMIFIFIGAFGSIIAAGVLAGGS